MEFRPHKSKMCVMWKNDKIYCNTESIWTDKYWKRTNGYRFKMTDTQNVLFWLNLKFSTYIFLKPKYFTQFPYFYVFRNLFAFILNLFFYGSDRYSFEKMNSRVFFYKLRANNFKLLHSRKCLFFICLFTFVKKSQIFTLSGRANAVWIFSKIAENEYFLEEIFLHYRPQTIARIYYEIFKYSKHLFGTKLPIIFIFLRKLILVEMFQ